MSTDFVTDKQIPFSKIKKFNYSGVKVDEIDEDGNVVLTDGNNFFWAFQNTDFETSGLGGHEAEFEPSFHYEGVVFTRHGANDPDTIIEAIEAFFNVRLISEYEVEYDEIIRRKQAVLKIVNKS